MTLTLAEFTEGRIVEAMHLEKDTKTVVDGYTVYKTKADITDEDYLKNVAFIGELTSGLKVVVIMDNAICTGALELYLKITNLQPLN